MSKLYTMVYDTDEYGVKRATRCVPQKGALLFEIKATYADLVPSSTYYYLGRTKKEAVNRFKNVTGSWLKITSTRLIPLPGDEAEAILTDVKRMPV